jgi:hypothetical protein
MECQRRGLFVSKIEVYRVYHQCGPGPQEQKLTVPISANEILIPEPLPTLSLSTDVDARLSAGLNRAYKTLT